MDKKNSFFLLGVFNIAGYLKTICCNKFLLHAVSGIDKFKKINIPIIAMKKTFALSKQPIGFF